MKHRNICKIIDFEVVERTNQNSIYILTEAYNASLSDLYFTSKHENAEISEDQLTSAAFQILKAICFLNQAGLSMHSMLRMESIYFDLNVRE